MSLDDYSPIPDPYERHEYHHKVRGESKLWGVSQDGILYLIRSARDTYFRNKRGYASSMEVLSEAAKRYRVRMVQIQVIHSDGRQYYTIVSSMDDWFKHGQEYVDTSNGFKDPQRVLPLSYFTTEDGSAIQIYNAIPSPIEEEQYFRKYGRWRAKE